MKEFTYLILLYLAGINLVGFILMGIDKHKARKHLWRIPERTLFLTAILGGSIGVFLGMHTFHHKTKHTSFVVGIPLIIVIQAIPLFLYILEII